MALENPRFVDGQAMLIAGINRRYPRDKLDRIAEQWAALPQQLQFISGRLNAKTYGVWYDVLKPGGGPMHYATGVLVGEFAPIHPSLSRFNIPPQRYAVFAHRGAASEIRKTVDAIFSQWLPKSGKQHHYEGSGAPDFFEVYGENFDPATGLGDIEVWVPIKK